MFCGMTGGSVFSEATSYDVCGFSDFDETLAASFAKAGSRLW